MIAVGLVNRVPETACRSVGGGRQDVEDRRGEALFEELRDTATSLGDGVLGLCLAISFLRSSGMLHGVERTAGPTRSGRSAFANKAQTFVC